jgi:RHS repeat-associated protein
LTQQRHSRNGDLWEDLTYHYQYSDQANEQGLLRNRLYHVNDFVGQVDPNGSDLDDQGAFQMNPNVIETANNYVYDEEGRLVQDKTEEIEHIVWTVSVLSRCMFSRFSTENFSKTTIGNGFVNRINFVAAFGGAKHVYDDDWMLEKSTYATDCWFSGTESLTIVRPDCSFSGISGYFLYAQSLSRWTQGIWRNQLSLYEHEVNAQTVACTLKERNIYGSTVLGFYGDSIDVYASQSTNTTSTVLGKKYYQLGDHRGNVNTVISDIKYPVEDNGYLDYFEAQIINIADYSGFGVQLDGRTIENSFYRRGFQNQERDDEIKGVGNSVNYKYRMHDPRVGRFFAVDPLAPEYPHNSPYAFSENRVIDGVELEGLEFTSAEGKFYGADNVDEYKVEVLNNPTASLKPKVSDGGSAPPVVINNQELPQTNESDFTNPLPEISFDQKIGVDIATGLVYSAAEETNMYNPKLKSKVPSTGANNTLNNLSQGAVKLNTIVTIADKGTKLANALSRGDMTTAGHHAVTGTGYFVAGAMMASPTGVTQIAGGLMFIGLVVYDIFAEPEEK